MKKSKCFINKIRSENTCNNQGFSMVELIIVIAIMAILAAALAPSLIRYIAKSQKATDVATARTIAETTLVALTEETEGSAISYGQAVSFTPSQSFYARSSGYNNATDVTSGGETYEFVLVAHTEYFDKAGNEHKETYSSNYKHGYTLKFRRAYDEGQPFVDALNANLGGAVQIKYRNKEMGGGFNRFFIGYRKDDPDQIEIWVGQEARFDLESTKKVRIYPNPDSSYVDD